MSTKYYNLEPLLKMNVEELLLTAARHEPPAVTTSYGGKNQGTIVNEHRLLNPTARLISDYGAVTTLTEVRAKAGEGKGAT
jgi:hypothetical protein